MNQMVSCILISRSRQPQPMGGFFCCLFKKRGLKRGRCSHNGRRTKDQNTLAFLSNASILANKFTFINRLKIRKRHTLQKAVKVKLVRNDVEVPTIQCNSNTKTLGITLPVCNRTSLPRLKPHHNRISIKLQHSILKR